jgi:hypothetical protein
MEVNPELFSILYTMLSEIKIPYKSLTARPRHNFPKHRSVVFGLVRYRYQGYTDLSRWTKLYPEIYKELQNIIKIIKPDFKYTSIVLNNNVICPPHKDSNNVGDSLLISFGDYTGCNLVVDNIEYNTNCRYIIFNGSELEHYNTDNLKGNKYTIIYYNVNSNTKL